MENLETLDLTALIDLLVARMVEYHHLSLDGLNIDRFEECGKQIEAIQAEIELRKRNWYNTPNTT